MLKFYYNGIKENGEKLQTAHYSMGGYTDLPDATITIYNRDYLRFSTEIRESFKVDNDTDSMTDYFCKDRIRVLPDHKLYAEVSNAYLKQQDRYSKKYNTGGVK
tara:strand:- start:140 stop:451 length:312 start_codon:yes stop_codon:yes gene_type:complete